MDTAEVFEPIIDERMRQLKCLSPTGIGFRRAWHEPPRSTDAQSRAPAEDYSSLMYGNSPSGDWSIVVLSSQSLPSLSDSDAAIIGAVTYTMVAIQAYCKKADVESCIEALSDVFCMNKQRTKRLYEDIASVPCVAHIYSRNLQPEMNPFYKQKAFENEQLILETKLYAEYQEQELAHTRSELLQVVNMLYFTIHIPRFKVTLSSDPSPVAIGPAAKVEKRTFYIEIQVSSHVYLHAITDISLQAGSATICLGVLPHSIGGGGVRGSIDAQKLSLNAVIPIPSNKVLFFFTQQAAFERVLLFLEQTVS